MEPIKFEVARSNIISMVVGMKQNSEFRIDQYGPDKDMAVNILHDFDNIETGETQGLGDAACLAMIHQAVENKDGDTLISIWKEICKYRKSQYVDWYTRIVSAIGPLWAVGGKNINEATFMIVPEKYRVEFPSTKYHPEYTSPRLELLRDRWVSQAKSLNNPKLQPATRLGHANRIFVSTSLYPRMQEEIITIVLGREALNTLTEYEPEKRWDAFYNMMSALIKPVSEPKEEKVKMEQYIKFTGTRHLTQLAVKIETLAEAVSAWNDAFSTGGDRDPNKVITKLVNIIHHTPIEHQETLLQSRLPIQLFKSMRTCTPVERSFMIEGYLNTILGGEAKPIDKVEVKPDVPKPVKDILDALNLRNFYDATIKLQKAAMEFHAENGMSFKDIRDLVIKSAQKSSPLTDYQLQVLNIALNVIVVMRSDNQEEEEPMEVNVGHTTEEAIMTLNEIFGEDKLPKMLGGIKAVLSSGEPISKDTLRDLILSGDFDVEEDPCECLQCTSNYAQLSDHALTETAMVFGKLDMCFDGICVTNESLWSTLSICFDNHVYTSGISYPEWMKGYVVDTLLSRPEIAKFITHHVNPPVGLPGGRQYNPAGNYQNPLPGYAGNHTNYGLVPHPQQLGMVHGGVNQTSEKIAKSFCVGDLTHVVEYDVIGKQTTVKFVNQYGQEGVIVQPVKSTITQFEAFYSWYLEAVTSKDLVTVHPSQAMNEIQKYIK